MQQHPDHNTSPRQVSRRRSLFLPGFVLGFLVLTALTCGGSLYAAGIDGGRLAVLRNGGAVWTPPPTPLATIVEQPPTATDQWTSDATFRRGERPRNVTASQVNVRSSPGYLGKPSGDVIAQAAPGDQVEIVEGPETADGLVWWLVRLQQEDGGSTEGWMAEATASGVQILGE